MDCFAKHEFDFFAIGAETYEGDRNGSQYTSRCKFYPMSNLYLSIKVVGDPSLT